MFWVNMMAVKGERFGEYVAGCFPDNLVSYGKLAEDKVCFTFDKVYSKRWVLMNQLSTITPMPKAWDRTADGPSDASFGLENVAAVYDFLMARERRRHRGGQLRPRALGRQPGVERGQRPVAAEELHHGGRRHLRPQRALLRAEQGAPGRVPADPVHVRRRGVPEAAGGAGGPDNIQVGYLPLSFSTEPTDDPTKGGPNPLGENYTLVPQAAFCIRYIPLNYNNPTVAGKMLAQTYIRQAMQHTLDQDRASRDIYHGYAYRQDGPVPRYPVSDLVSPRLGRAGRLPFDPDRARALLEANGWDTSTTPAICVNPGEGPGQAGSGHPRGHPAQLLLRYAEGRPALTRLMEQFRDDAVKAGIELRLQEVYGSVLVAEDAPCVAGPDSPCLWELSTWAAAG